MVISIQGPSVKAQALSEISGMLHVFLVHTSCGLTLNESFDPTAKQDMESFLKRIAPRHESWYAHTIEGPDDSPSHLKSLLLNHSLSLIVEQGKMILGQWQGIYLAEFRDAPHQRQLILKFVPDQGATRW